MDKSRKIRDVLDRLGGVVKELETVFAEDGDVPELPQEAQDLLKSGLCLYCREILEDGRKVVRGCHERCNRAISNRVKAGELTDRDTILFGYRTAPAVSGRKSRVSKRILLDMERREREEKARQEAERLAEMAANHKASGRKKRVRKK